MATTCPILVEQDIPVRLRDGVTIRVDIFRPAGTERVPVIMGWSSYGKRASWLTLDLFGHPTRMDVKKEWEDGLNKFEGPNPAYWVAHGYAVASPDPRGVFMSEGDIQAWGPQEARDAFLVNIPLKRGGKPEDVANVVCFLCGPDSDYVTGQVLNVDGGFLMS